MAPKFTFRPSRARATLIAVIAVLSVLVLLAAPVSACDCTYGVISYRPWAKCWSDGPGMGSYVKLPYNYQYDIDCQRSGSSVRGNKWWNEISYDGGYCWINDYYMKTGCATRCNNLPIC